MKQNLFLTALVFMILVVGLNGCCNRCKNKPDSSVPTAVAGQDTYTGSQNQIGADNLTVRRDATK